MLRKDGYFGFFVCFLICDFILILLEAENNAGIETVRLWFGFTWDLCSKIDEIDAVKFIKGNLVFFWFKEGYYYINQLNIY